MSDTALAEGPARSAQRWPDGYFTTRDGAELHYVESGEGHPVILIHGARGSAIGNWFSNGIAPKLAETNKVYALDMRGHGLSEAKMPVGGLPFNHNAMADDILEFMDQMGIEKAHMGGYSMGGFILVQLMMRAPERFISCCLQGSGVNETPEWRDLVPPDKEGRDPDQEKAEEVVRQRRLAKGEEIGNNFSDGPMRRPGPNGMPPGFENRPPEFQEMWRKREEAIAAFDFSKIKFPVMAINGEYDRPLSKTHRFWRQLHDFTNLILPGKSHLTAMMAGFVPQESIEGFAAFIARNNPRD